MLDLSRVDGLGEALRDATIASKSRTALFEVDRHRETARLTYRELLQAAERLAARLQKAGVAAGDRVAILMSNQSKWVVSSFGVFWSGAVLVPLDYKLTPSEQLALLAHARPKALITEAPVWKDLVALEPSLTERCAVFVSETRGSDDLGAATRWEDHDDSPFTFVRRGRSDVASVVYSSGTGGTPKGCMLTHDNYLEQAQVLGRMYPMELDDRYLSILPTNHAIDFMCGTVIPFLFGAAVVHQRTLRAEFLAPTMKRYRVTHTALVPRILKALREKIEEQIEALPAWKRGLVDSLVGINDLATMRGPNHGLSRTLLKPIHDRFGGHLRTIFAGGAFVEPDLAQFFYKLGFPVVIGYGLTEACTVLTLNDLSPFRPNTVGRPVDGVELELRDLSSDGVGEVYVRGRTVMAGYLDAPDLTAEALEDGWLRTGDLGSVDASGHLRLVGRARNMIVTEGGKNVYPEDVESVFERVDCEELCVFAASYVWPREQTGEELIIVVRLQKGQRRERLCAAVVEANKELVDYKRVASVVFWEHEFPRTASMKIKRQELAKQVRASVAQAELLRAS